MSTDGTDPVTPEGLSLLSEFCQVFAPLRIQGMSLARVLFYDYLRFLCNLPQLVERRRELGDLPSIPWSRLQSSLVGHYPETCRSDGPVLIEGPMASLSPRRVPGCYYHRDNQGGGAVPPGKDLNLFRRGMGNYCTAWPAIPSLVIPGFAGGLSLWRKKRSPVYTARG